MDIGVTGKLGVDVLLPVDPERHTAIVTVFTHLPAEEIHAKGKIVNLKDVRILAVSCQSIKISDVVS